VSGDESAKILNPFVDVVSSTTFNKVVRLSPPFPLHFLRGNGV
jgi:hypothetical protein